MEEIKIILTMTGEQDRTVKEAIIIPNLEMIMKAF